MLPCNQPWPWIAFIATVSKLAVRENVPNLFFTKNNFWWPQTFFDRRAISDACLLVKSNNFEQITLRWHIEYFHKLDTVYIPV